MKQIKQDRGVPLAINRICRDADHERGGAIFADRAR
jgi:hypothetical protein